jgi:hypothetical protein
MISVKTGNITSEQPNPDYAAWLVRDQALLGYLFSSLTRDALMGVTTATTSAAAWSDLQEMYAPRMRARSVNTRITLANTKKGTTSMAEYFSKIKCYADELASSGQTLTDEEFVAYVLAGLDEEFYNPLVSSIVARAEPISPQELYSQMLLSYELRVDKQSGGSYSSANTSSRGRGAPWSPRGMPNSGHDRGCSHGNGHRSPTPPSRGGFNTNNSNNSFWCTAPTDSTGGPNRPRSQVCLKVGHTVNICWYRFDQDFIPDSRVAAMASSSNGADPNWYLDSGVTDHITGELEKLTMHERYHWTDQIRAANGAGMDIVHVGKSVLPTITHPLHLNHVLHVPNTHKQLISIHRFNLDNNTFIELHPFFFLIEDQVTRKVLLRGPCRGGRYPLPQLSSPTQKLILSAIKSSSERWHCRLGHPALDIVLHVIRDNNLSCYGFASSESVCDACLRAKAHQLPYPRSFSQSTAPLELIFSDVWGLAIDSFDNKKFYVSFIDDFSKFIWIYLLRRKSEVFQFFQEFQSLVERMFHQKILAVQTDWGGEYERLNSFFRTIGVSHHVSCPHAHQQNGATERKHRHIVEMGLALLANASMPLKFWDQAFLTTTHLINRTPTKILDHDTSLHRLLGATPDYSNLCVFGCAC